MTRDVRPSRTRRIVAGAGAMLMALAIGLPPFTASTTVSAANPPLDGVIDVEAGGKFACAIVNEDANATTGSVWCWGDNFRGQLGVNDDTLSNSLIARKVSNGETGFTNTEVELLALGKEHACAVESDELYCWGSNSSGKAGVASAGTSSSSEVGAPAKVAKPSGVTEWTSVALGDEHTCALTNKDVGGSAVNGVVYCWGHGDYLGNGNLSSIKSTDNDFITLAPTFPTNAVRWDDANDGARNEQGNTTPTPIADVDVSASGTNNWNYEYSGGAGWIFANVSNSGYSLISAGPTHSCAAKTAGSEEGVYCWGNNESGQSFMNNSLPLIWQPSKFNGDSSFSKTWDRTGIQELASKDGGNCVVKNEAALTNAVFCWSQSIFGGASNWGAGFIDSNTVVEEVSQLSLVSRSMWEERFACGVQNGSIICFGRRDTSAALMSQLGAGEMGSNGAVTDLSLGGFSRGLGCAVRSGGAYCWVVGSQTGGNDVGQLGNDSTLPSDTPVRVLRTPPPPEAPSNLVATPGDATISIAFTPGATNGWSVTTYQYSLDGGTTWSYLRRPLLTSPIVIELDHSNLPLRNGQEYTVILRLADGNTFTGPTITGDPSAAVTATPAAPTAPGSPTGVTATVGDTSATVSWSAPASDGGAPITGYVARAVGEASLSCTAAADATSCEITGLTNGTPYTFEVIAKNLIGDSGASSPSAEVTPAAAGGASEGSSGGTTGGTLTDSGSSDGTSTGTGSTDGGNSTSTGPIAAPATATASEAVTADDAAALASEPGDGKVVIDGTAVTPTVGRVTADGADTPAAERTPEQVAAVQAAARTLVESFNTLAGDDSPIEVTNTATGAVITGLLTNPDDPDTPVEVPAERVLVMTAGDVAIMMVATGTDGTPLALDDGALQVTGDGNVAVALAGLPASTAGEIVLLPSRTVIGTFTTTADGTLAGEVVMPTDLAAGDYGIAIAVGTTRTSIGVKALPSTAVLPATGGENAPATMALALFALGMLLVVSGRRRTSAH